MQCNKGSARKALVAAGPGGAEGGKGKLPDEEGQMGDEVGVMEYSRACLEPLRKFMIRGWLILGVVVKIKAHELGLLEEVEQHLSVMSEITAHHQCRQREKDASSMFGTHRWMLAIRSVMAGSTAG